MIPRWTTLPPDTKAKIIACIASTEIEGDDLEEVEGSKVIGHHLAEMMALEVYCTIRHLTKEHV